MKLRYLSVLIAVAILSQSTLAADPWIVLPGGEGPGKGKHIVLISGDEEYRSEEALPQLAKILSTHHGFRCTVLFAIDKDGETINPMRNDNIPGLEALKTADLMVLFTRFRNLPTEQLEHFAAYLKSGKPIIGLRTATHAFNLGKDTKFPEYHWQSKVEGWEGGFGRKILGETWVAHHGSHGKEGARGILAKEQAKHPILKGIADGDIFGTSDVYTVKLPLPGDSLPLVMGEVTETLKSDSPAVKSKKNDPMMPIAWTKTYTIDDGKPARVFTTTMGASQDFAFEGTRRMVVNACFWAVGLEDKIPSKSNVEIVGEYKPTPFKSGAHKAGVKPADLLK